LIHATQALKEEVNVSSITTNPAASSAHLLPEVLALAEPHSAGSAKGPAAMLAKPEPISVTTSSLASFVPPGGLHPVTDEAHAKRTISMFLRRVWRDGAL
jgi:hypothetical protein